MPTPLTTYLKELAKTHNSGLSTEHSFRPALQRLLEQLIPHAQTTNEPGQVKCGAPDYILTRNKIPLGYIEAKDIDKSLDDKIHREQLHRYIESLDNLIFTNYLEFRFYRDGDTTPAAAVSIAELRNGKIKPLSKNFDEFAALLQTFGEYEGQTITAADDLAARMAGKARLLANTIGKALDVEDQTSESRTLDSQMRAFKKILIADITVNKFADVYAQTIAYGMFAARLHDTRPKDFTRHKAVQLIPQSNPFLKKFFGYIAEYDLDERIRWIVDDLADIFRATNVEELMKDFGKTTQRTDPFIHFYETFLGKYDKKERKNRGVYYTPEPVVNFIVRAVDEILKNEFNLSGGLADTAKTTVTMDDKPKEIHKVQILDPATGTGTFLAEVIKQIYDTFAGQQGIWRDYVKENLIPRLNGFEVLMAPYSMAHLKLEMILRETKCELGNDRLRVFLTNSLEEYQPVSESVFAAWLSEESELANEIKRDVPVMVVLGNPPYSSISSNMGKWINELIEDYKYVDGKHFGERKHWLHDDYVKFIRYGEHLVNKTGEGVLAYINNHGFLDNPTFRGMRWHLLRSFDKIFVLDLHGNVKKEEISPDGSPDKNVFDIQQGVSINLFVKTGKKKEDVLGEVFHHDLFGERESKYQLLWQHDLTKTKFKKLETLAPNYFFVPKDYSVESEYNEGFAVNDLMPINVTGIVTARDSLVIDFDKEKLVERIKSFSDADQSDDSVREKYFKKTSRGKYPPGDTRGWKLSLARNKIKDYPHRDIVKIIAYRVFDDRYIYYHPDMVDWGREKIMRHFIEGDVVGLIFQRGSGGKRSLTTPQVTKNIFDQGLCYPSTSALTYGASLYLYPETKQQTVDGKQNRKPNLNPDIVKTIADKISLRFTSEKTDDAKTFAPIDLLDYIYAVLHNPTYRQKFWEFLKIDFPRVPLPRDAEQFRALAKLGAELRALHLLESKKLNTLITTYPQPGDNTVTNIRFDDGKVWINDTQHFAGVPQTAWEFHIGGYQPAQKWLKDRKGRRLSSDEIKHYQRVVVALVETGRVMEKLTG